MQGLRPLPRLRQTAQCNESRYPSVFFALATLDPVSCQACFTAFLRGHGIHV